jgi:hypothetical protein
MKRFFLLFALLAVVAVGAQVFLACDDDDDDNDDNNDTDLDDDSADDDAATAPQIPHGEQGDCLDCHGDAHSGAYTNDQCLGCHQYAG